MSVEIRHEHPSDIDVIHTLTQAAFATAAHASGTEAWIVRALRGADALSISLVAADTSGVIGHVAVSPVTISDGTCHWYGLGPISVAPHRQREGIGSQLMRAAISQLEALGAAGCVLLGDPNYYQRFGFTPVEGLTLDGVPPEYFQALVIGDEVPQGQVSYHSGFEATANEKHQ